MSFNSGNWQQASIYYLNYKSKFLKTRLVLCDPTLGQIPHTCQCFEWPVNEPYTTFTTFTHQNLSFILYTFIPLKITNCTNKRFVWTWHLESKLCLLVERSVRSRFFKNVEPTWMLKWHTKRAVVFPALEVPIF